MRRIVLWKNSRMPIEFKYFVEFIIMGGKYREKAFNVRRYNRKKCYKAIRTELLILFISVTFLGKNPMLLKLILIKKETSTDFIVILKKFKIILSSRMLLIKKILKKFHLT